MRARLARPASHTHARASECCALEIHYTFAKFQENTTILSYIHVQDTIDTIYDIRKTHCSVGITGYEYVLA